VSFSPTLTQIGTVAQKAPIVGGIISNLTSVGQAVGIKIDTTSPSQHVAERTSNGERLKSAAISGSNLAWEKLWIASGRPLPVRRVADVARVGDDKSTQANEFFGWPRVGDVLTAMLRDVENFRGALPAPSGLTQNQIIAMSTDTVLSGMTTQSLGGNVGSSLFENGVGTSPANHAGAQSLGAPTSTNYVVVGGIILAMLLILRKRG